MALSFRIANKLPMEGKVFQDAHGAAQIQHNRGLALFWLLEKR